MCPMCGASNTRFLLKDEEIDSIGRMMVHLSGTFNAALEAGRVRIQVPVILEINAKTARDAGVVIKKAGKTVYLTKEIPPEFLRRSERAEEELSPEEAPPG